MNTRQLEYVIAVAEERSFSKAADKLHISQPSLSQYIRNIEKSLEVNLFDRSVTPLSLTEIGEEYLKTAYRIIALENNLLKCISDQREKRKTTLNIGISAALNTWEISLALAEVRTKYPDTIINAHELFSINMDDLLEQGELDFSISPINDKYDMAHFSRDIILRDRMYLAASRGVLKQYVPELADAVTGDTVKLSAFAQVPFFTLSTQSQHALSFQKAVEGAGFSPNVIMRCRREEMLMDLVEKNVGVTLISDRFLMDYNVKKDVVILKLIPQPPELVSAISYLRGSHLTDAAKAFIKCYMRIVGDSRDANGYLKDPYLS